ncbi:uncharacterized protein L201_000331 [Kwoniella dendrophila CBS 6074]|uniref:B30.2/SPRY domain-containing protein n=1 Tax=Kwoniella dendrophila CBS 6074 TaxID=1295534 RepID=A0AAX4JL07_9TREE
MPPHRGHSPPVDPFPPLRRAGSSSSASPSYASIAARSSSHPHITEEDLRVRDEMMNLHRNAERSTRQRYRDWDEGDVDRVEGLDELNVYAEPININPSPPWRSRSSQSQRERRRSDPTINPEDTASGQAGLSGSRLTETPSSTIQNRSNAIANGARNPDSQGDVSTPPPQIPTRPSNHSPPSPSPTRPNRTEPSPPSHLAPMFTLEELLHIQPEETEQPAAASTIRNRLRGPTVRVSAEATRRGGEFAPNSSSSWGMGMQRALPTGAGAGFSHAIGNLDDPSIMDQTTGPSSDPIIIPFPSSDIQDPVNRVHYRLNTRPLDGSGSGNGSTSASATNAGQEITSFLRRRRRNPARGPVTTIETFDPDEVIPFDQTLGYSQSEEEDFSNLNDLDSDEERWNSRLRIHNHVDGDREFDVDGPVSAQIPNRSSLHRGRNNRRRRSLLQRIGAPPDLRFPEEFEEEATEFPPPIRGIGDATGCEPTNKDIAEIIVPLIVRSRGITRPRAEDSEKSSPIRKKRKTSSHPNEEESSLRPSYLDLSTLPTSTPLPANFIPPLRYSHLALSTYKSASLPLRPLITFVGCKPTRGDADATSLYTTIPIPLECGVHYYEAEVINKGEEGFMSVGWMKRGANLRRLVGWDKGSWGWHGDDGRSFEGQGRGDRFSETWTTGDTVGCGLDFTTGRAFFTKNGQMMGHRFSNMSSGLHPAIGLRSVGESIAINFTGPFKFDIDSYVKSTKDGIWANINSTQVDKIPRLVDQVRVQSKSNSAISSPDNSLDNQDETKPASKAALACALEKELKEIEVETPSPASPSNPKHALDPIEKTSAALVLDYLQHNGHSRALSLLRTNMIKRERLPPTKAVSEVSIGNTDINISSTEITLADFSSKQQALKWLHASITKSFENPLPSKLIKGLSTSSLPGSVSAQLEIYEFIHLLHLSSLPEAKDETLDIVLEKGRMMRTNHCDSRPAGVKEIAEKAFGILSNPTGMNDPFWKEQRKQWADALIRELKELNELNQVSHLEQALRQTNVVIKTLSEKSGKSGAAFIDTGKVSR